MTDDRTKQVILIGFGGQGRVVQDALVLTGQSLAGYIDQREYPSSVAYLGADIAALTADAIHEHTFHVAIGDNAIRANLIAELHRRNAKLATVIHPSAIVASSAELAAGVFVGARAVVNPAATIAEGAIVNTGAIVEHDCVVGSCAHVAPGAVLCGGVQLAERVLVGANATVLPGVRLGTNARLGAGALLKKDLEADVTIR